MERDNYMVHILMQQHTQFENAIERLLFFKRLEVHHNLPKLICKVLTASQIVARLL